jgi:hypothetical protein
MLLSIFVLNKSPELPCELTTSQPNSLKLLFGLGIVKYNNCACSGLKMKEVVFPECWSIYRVAQNNVYTL